MKCDKCIHKELCKTAEFEHFYGADECEFYDGKKHGEWIRTNPLTDTFECSLCGMQIPVLEMCSPFCPLCGARMGERKEAE